MKLKTVIDLLYEVDKENLIKNIELGKKLAAAYINCFSAKVIENIDFRNIKDTKKETRLNLFSISDFTEEEIESLHFEDIYKISFGNYTYVLVNLKGYVIEYIKNAEKQIVDNLKIDDVLKELNENMVIDEYMISKHKEQLYIKSLLYNYALGVILENAKTKLELTRAGMFKNAYFDILQIAENKLNQNINTKKSL